MLTARSPVVQTTSRSSMANQPPHQEQDGKVRDWFPKTCEYCGATLELTEWCPVVSTTDAEGTLQFHTFCDEDCMDAWDGA